MYIFVIGGVISSMRVISSSIRALLKWGSYFPLTFNELTHIVCTNLCRLPFLHLGFRVRSSELFGSFYLKKFNTCDWRLQWKTDHTKIIQKKVDPLVHFCYAMSLFKLILWICTFYLFLNAFCCFVLLNCMLTVELPYWPYLLELVGVVVVVDTCLMIYFHYNYQHKKKMSYPSSVLKLF